MRIQLPLALQTATTRADASRRNEALQAGNIVRGEVAESSAGQVVLRLPGGGLVRARVVSEVRLSEGEHVALQVMGNEGGQAVLRLLPDVDAVDVALRSLVQRSGLPGDEQARALADLMLEHGMPVDPEVLGAAYRILQQQPSLAPRIALFMAANGLTATKEELMALGRMVSGVTTDAQISALLGQIVDLAASLESAAAVPAGGGALETQAPSQAAPLQEAQGATLAPAQDGARQSGPLPGQAADLRELPMPGPQVSAAMSRLIHTHFPLAARALPAAEWAAPLAAAAREASLMPHEAAAPFLGDFVDALPSYLTPEQKNALTDMLRTVADALRPPDTMLGTNLQGPERLRALAGELRVLFAQDAADLPRAADALRPGLVAARRELVAMGVPSDNPVMAAAQQTLAQVRVADSFARFAYVQIPMQQDGRDTSVELYVMKRGGGRKRIDPERATMLVALNTQYMGRVESMIQVEGKSVSLRFRLQSQEALEHLRGHALSLHEQFLQRGFRLGDVRCALLAQPVTPVTVEEELSRAFGASEGQVYIYI